jgi:hypothetical protein
MQTEVLEGLEEGQEVVANPPNLPRQGGFGGAMGGPGGGGVIIREVR